MEQIVTGEAVVLDLPCARFPARILSRIIDMAVELVLFGVIATLIGIADEHAGRRNRGRSRYANGLARKAPFAKKIARSKNCYNSFFACLIDHGKLHTAFPDVHDILRGIALREDGLFSSKLANHSPQTGRIEE